MSSLPPNTLENGENPAKSSAQTYFKNIRNLVATSALALTTACVTITTKPPQTMGMPSERYLEPNQYPNSPLENTAFRNITPAIQDFQHAIETTSDHTHIQSIKNQILGEAELLSNENVLLLARYFSDKSRLASGEAKRQYANISAGMYLITNNRRQNNSSVLPAFGEHVLPRQPSPNISEYREYADINFRVTRGSVKIHGRDYILDARASVRPVQIAPDTYELQLPFRRDSRSSLRGDEIITLRFRYDGYQLSFFGDKNRNKNWDRYEDARTYTINHTEEIVRQGNRIFRRNAIIPVQLDRKHISSSQRVEDLRFEIVLQ